MSRTISALDDENADQAASSRAGFGSLETDRGLLPLVAMDVRTRISDVIAEMTIRQTFRNGLSEPLEATCIFPLPDRAAVTKFRMHVAGRTIDGDLKERGAAREEYDRAIQQGHRAAIAEEERSGVFNLRVGNIPAREEATIELTLVGPLSVSDGEATFRFPLVVAPRYTPGIPLDGPSVGSGMTPDTDQVPDASRVTPPVLLPGFPNPIRLSLEVQLDAAAVAAGPTTWRDQVKSSLHSTITDDGPPWTIRLRPEERLNRDFILRFPVAGTSIGSSLQVTPRAMANQASSRSLCYLPRWPTSGQNPARSCSFSIARAVCKVGKWWLPVVRWDA
jgi:Ca-activated chloride channel homolog